MLAAAAVGIAAAAGGCGAAARPAAPHAAADRVATARQPAATTGKAEAPADRAATARARRPAARPALARPPRRQLAHFALLRTRPEGMPARALAALRGSEAGASWRLAQRMPAMTRGAYWLVPGVGRLCIASRLPGTPGVGTVCAATARVMREGLATISIAPPSPATQGRPSRLVVGIAPDGTREALVHTGGAVAAAPVSRGVFVLRDAAGAPADRLTLR